MADGDRSDSIKNAQARAAKNEQARRNKWEMEVLRRFERVERIALLLGGEIGDARRSQSAVLRGELAKLGSRAMKMRAERATAAPTQAEYNALLDDVQDIYRSFELLSNILGNYRGLK